MRTTALRGLCHAARSFSPARAVNSRGCYRHASTSSWRSRGRVSKSQLRLLVGCGVAGGAWLYPAEWEALCETEEETDPAAEVVPRKKTVHYDYVVIGTGTAAHAATEVIRQNDPKGRILIVREDNKMPRLDVEEDESEGLVKELSDIYNRWRRHISDDLRSIVGRTGFGEQAEIDLEIAHPTMRLDVENKTIDFKSGSRVVYSKCLIAKPGTPRHFYVIDSNVMAYSLTDHVNTLKDALEFSTLEEVLRKGSRRIAIVGGGFLGTEISAALAELNKKLDAKNELTHIFVEHSVLERYLPDYLSEHTLKKLVDNGVKVVRNHIVSGVLRAEPSQSQSTDGKELDSIRATLMHGGDKTEHDFDYLVLASTHVDPQVRLGLNSGLEIDSVNGGIVVNRALQAFEGLYVAGDAASYYSPLLGRRRVDVYDHAMNSGLCCGQNMSNKEDKVYNYTHQASFVSSLAGTGLNFECVGEIDSKLHTVGVWLAKRDEKTGTPCVDETDYERGIVYYIRDSKVVGVLCCNAGECLEAGKEVIREGKTIVDDAGKQLKKKILLAPTEWLLVRDSK